MKLALSTSSPSQLETECLVVSVLDQGDAKNPAPVVQTSDSTLLALAKPLIENKELTGKAFEQLFLYSPQGVKAKRVLFLGGGKAKDYSSVELRRVAGAAVRAMKPKNLKSFALLAPETWTGKADPEAHSTFAFERGGSTEAVRAIAEGIVAGNFDADYYKSDRKDQQVNDATIVVTAKEDQKALGAALTEGVNIAESQNFA